MCFLFRCTKPDPPPQSDQTEIYADLWTLAGLLAPISFVAKNRSELQKLMRRLASPVNLGTRRPEVAVFIVAG
jgi:hypothetical protein